MLETTRLLKIESLSQITGCEIFAKAEFLHLGGSIKDRAAYAMIQAALKSGQVKSGGTIVEGTAGNTGIGLGVYAAKLGLKAVVVMPDNQSLEKYQTLSALGVELIKVAPCPFANPAHFYHTAKRIAEERNAFWLNQFENLENFKIHYQTTGPEIWQQMNMHIDAFLAASGTGGTIAGVSKFLKEQNNKIHIRLVDPLGSGLYSYIQNGEMKSTGSSITEGIGIMRLTENFKQAQIDSATQVDDQKMINMLYHLAHNDGLLVGTSSALNMHAAYEYAMERRNSGQRIVSILCDSAQRYASKVFNEDFLREKGIEPKALI